MPNLYGVANEPNLLVPTTGLIGGVDVTISSGVETNLVDSGALIAPSNGYFYPFVSGTLVWNCASAAPVGLVFAARIGAGADFDQYLTNLTGVTVGPTYTWGFSLLGTASQIPWQGAGSHIFVTGLSNSAGTVTLLNRGAHFIIGLLRAPDQ